MIFRMLGNSDREAVRSIFQSAFTASEGEKEGRLIGRLASELSAGIDGREILNFGACEEERIIASIFFTRLRFETEIQVYMLAPVAVCAEHQRRGAGQALIRHGLEDLKSRAVDMAVTYGDPGYYSRFGFRPLPETVIQAPLDLSMPHGWQGLSLTGAPVRAIRGRPVCVKQFNDPVYW